MRFGRRLFPVLLTLLAGGVGAQARFDPATQQLRIPTVEVEGQLYRDALLRLDADGRLSLLALSPPPVSPPNQLAARVAAASQAAQSDARCTAVRPFYWEMGDASQRLAGGSVGLPSIEAGSQLPIASSSKWIYAAYVLERRAGQPTAEDIQFLNFRSGYTQFPPNGCQAQDTVASCLARDNNGVKTPAHEGFFYYGGGHMQKHANQPSMGLGALDNAGLAAELRRLLGQDVALAYLQPQPAGGLRMTARDYATFLRKLLGGQLRMSAWLGAQAVCTNPARCSQALYTPVPATQSWHYGLGHWIEDDPAGDGAFSSAGAFGFYPWIDAQRSHYGVLARFDAGGAGADSSACGAAIRQAWVGAAPLAAASRRRQ
ncbi:hypothetical protein [Inhella sp.]|uniref:hypothetical protein n=1 Tax=Inhella sp. TaxID=1921806 RepID=UPI0035AF0F61